MTRTTRIKKIGNGAFLPLTRDTLEELHADIGTEVSLSVDDGRLTVAKADSTYEQTRDMARKMRARYARTLKLFGQ